MILNGFIYIFSLGLLWSVPETWIGVLYSKIVNKFKKKTNFKTILPKLTQLMHDLRFSSLNYKEELNFPKYKYFSSLISTILFISKQYGGQAYLALNEVRHGLSKDLQFEEKYKKESNSGLAQMLVLLLMVWSFVFFARIFAEIDFLWSVYFIIFTLHILGMTTFVFCQKWIKNRLFLGPEQYFCALYSMKALLSSGVPLNLALKLSKLENIFDDDTFKFKGIREGLKGALERLQSKGAPILDDLELLIQELWFIQEEAFVEFGRKFLSLRLGVLSVFFLGSYLFFMASLVSVLLQKL